MNHISTIMRLAKYTCFSIFLCLALTIQGQDSLNMVRVGQWNPSGMPSSGGVTYNDVWGYTTPTGEEYAIVGNVDSIMIVDVTDCSTPTCVFGYEGGSTAIWRDFKTYGEYVYAVCDGCNEGLHIFDMSALPGGNVTHELTTTEFFTKAHNIYIDTAEQTLYAVGSNTVSEGFVMLDLSTPDNPTLIDEIHLDDEAGLPSSNFYVHDVFVQNDTAYASHGNTGFFVWDMSDLSNIEILGEYDSNGYNHSSWINSDGGYAYFAEEVPTGLPLSVVDLANLGHPTQDINVVHTFRDRLGTSGFPTPHNPFVKEDTLYISYYEDGIKMYDLSTPDLPVLIAYYDTYPDNGNGYSGYNGAWGTYPFFDSGCICVSDIDYGLNTIEFCQFEDYYLDSDGDGYGDANIFINACEIPTGYVDDKTDCDDTNAAINPGATEQCDGIDNNCNGQVDEGLLTTYYIDLDGDGYGDAAASQSACTQPTGYVTNNTDCNDGDSNISPGATEQCDGIDNNCDGQVDEGLLTTYYQDADGDGYGHASNTTQACSLPSGYATNNTDCDDTDQNINPSATEICNDGADNNCDGQVDENCVLDPCDAINLFISNITQDTSRAKQLLESDVVIANTEDVVFRAGNEIMLLPDFEVIQGAEFLAEIRDCEVTSSSSAVVGPAAALTIYNELKTKSFPSDSRYLLYNQYGELKATNVTYNKVLQILSQLNDKQAYLLIINKGESGKLK